ncbi:serine hydrolase domain-containing protein [Pontibacter sp. G13]|uniref:serine hydrolase domain-containing protein n=1 Tax=Pontibacter sp. G13 TaxID=3074898 RepID=UPI00288AD974|nr:serine hydrolase domain-containing protein [Pontibacter sp. G13]WNJ20247.1 serine hydrolase domain-containing protein [Pontibacter sp. G13]
MSVKLKAKHLWMVLLLLPISLACKGIDWNKLQEDLERENRTLAPVYMNRNIPNEAHNKMGEFIPDGISTFAMHPDGGWVIVSKKGRKFARNIPEECNKEIDNYLAQGHEIRCVAFPPEGGNCWVIVTDRNIFARNIPQEAFDTLIDWQKQGEEIRCIAFPFKRSTTNSWVIVADGRVSARNIDDECFQLMRNLLQSPTPNQGPSRPIHHVAFEPGGGWAILAEDYYFARNIDNDAFAQLGTFFNEKRENSLLVFDPDGTGWSVVANEQFTTRLLDDEIEQFEANVGGQSIWNRMAAANVPGVSVAVVVNNQLAWSTGYGHLAADKEDATHPESLFQAASISKVVTAIGIYRLIDDQSISLGANILNNLSVQIPARNCINPSTPLILQNVLQHQSTLMGRGSTFPLSRCANFRSGGGGYAGYDASASVPSLDQIIQGTGPTNSPPITRSMATPGNFRYSGDGYTLLQKLVEDLTSKPFAGWMKQEILTPTGMADSYFRMNLPSDYLTQGQLATGHDSQGNIISGRRRKYPEFAAAGLYTNSEDLAQMMIMLNQNGLAGSKRILTQTSRDNMVLNGIGVFTGNSSLTTQNGFYTHGGVNNGFKAIFVGFPTLGAGVAVMTNGDSQIAGLDTEIAQAVIQAYGW